MITQSAGALHRQIIKQYSGEITQHNYYTHLTASAQLSSTFLQYSIMTIKI